ncbi:Mu transposase C-terminal domain-containing protein [Acinetobacter nectaris]|uniref:Mu transposase C-terminal domain-containing protein n=1 Tax=Acinetobacter nectaris TaxID=1219382 RepID=UPI001F33FD40|nr:Mu transposase C-terminal domain-containing protein [Acinetobacter nectaris]
MKRYYSIAELMELQLESLPATRRGLEKFVKNNGFSYREVASRGKGGIRKEYELPKNLLGVIAIKTIKNEVKVSEPSELINDKKTSINNSQREIAAHRLIVVRYLQQQIRAGVKKTVAIEQLIEHASTQNLPSEILEAIHKANAKAGSKRTVSRRSLFDWIKTVEDAEQHDLELFSVLAPKARRQQDVPSWVIPFLKLWQQPQKPTITACLEQLPSYLNGSPCPSYSQAYRFLKQKMGNVEMMKGRMGTKELRNLRPFIRRDTSSLMPTDVYTADGHCFDAEVAHPLHGRPFRPEITSIIDVATRRVVGWSISLSESSWCVLDAIRMSATTCGIPAIFYVDNGSGYKNHLLNAQGHGVLARLHTEISHALPYNSQAKGIIERSHQTLWVKAAKNLPTYIGKDMDREASHAIHKTTRNEIKQFTVSKALMGWADFIDYASQVVDEYNNKPHSGLKRIIDNDSNKKRYQTPIEAWNEAVNNGAVIDIVKDWDAEDLFRPYEERKVRRGEIDLFGNRYFSVALEQFHGDTVLVGYDIHNADKITVRNLDGQFICHALWNANKRDYFPKSKIEQAVEKRAKGRLSRLAVHQDEALAEMSPRAVLEHIEDKNVILFDQNKREKLMAELDALPIHTEQHQPFFKNTSTVPEQSIRASRDDKVARWIALDKQVKGGEILKKQDEDFWKLFQLSKKFEQLSMSNDTLKDYLACRQA